MASSFVSQVAELEQALERVESSLHGAELQRTRALVAALLEVHRLALLDLRRVVGEAELLRAAAAEPSLAWLLACHDIDSEGLARAVASAEEKQARKARASSDDGGFVPVARLLRKQGEGEPAP